MKTFFLITSFLLVSVISFAQEKKEENKDDVNIQININEEDIENWVGSFALSMENMGNAIEKMVETELKQLKELEKLKNIEIDMKDLDLEIDGLNLQMNGLENLLNGTEMHFTFEEDDNVNLDDDILEAIKKKYGSEVDRVKEMDIRFEDSEVYFKIKALLKSGEEVKHKFRKKINEGC
ncbi:hypothetical protein [Sediminitomix flava]|uniref:Uncharacterized protein n=1 Tax=Sediminitomix flava TaxID=379075 RepID=A0A315Z119_SEDFL|nr:hypothetical protein [Sediminitomix flava]PWJ36005.1 hypothetical protein BC781_10918 [Sediminitomix flava]